MVQPCITEKTHEKILQVPRDVNRTLAQRISAVMPLIIAICRAALRAAAGREILRALTKRTAQKIKANREREQKWLRSYVRSA